MKSLVCVALCAIASFYSPATAQQIISDRQVGRVLAQVQCGDRSMKSALDYLNSMGVPPSKLNNPNQEIQRGYRAEKGWRTC